MKTKHLKKKCRNILDRKIKNIKKPPKKGEGILPVAPILKKG
jgi:hypothetical protein